MLIMCPLVCAHYSQSFEPEYKYNIILKYQLAFHKVILLKWKFHTLEIFLYNWGEFCIRGVSSRG